jgi:uncharacterized OsmC-like protein
MDADQLRAMQAPIKQRLLQLTERYCVVYQTIKSGPPVNVTLARR